MKKGHANLTLKTLVLNSASGVCHHELPKQPKKFRQRH